MSTEPQRHILCWPEHRMEMAFRLIPAGSFRMGSRGYYSDEEPAHHVIIPEPLWMAETPVTQAQFALCTRAAKIEHENGFKDHPEHPAENMDWRQAQFYCDWLTRNKASGLPEGFMLACLPTEAEWEYACRAGTDTEYYTGDGEAALAEAGWFGDNSGNQTCPVRQKEPNDFGLYDLHGNVWEWCHDEWDSFAYRQRADGESDPGFLKRLRDWHEGLEKLAATGRARVLRGGSWDGSADWCRSASRSGRRPVVRIWLGGFRVCLVRGPATGRGAQQQSGRPAPTPEPGDGGRGTRPESDGTGGGDSGALDLSRIKLPRVAGRNFLTIQNPMNPNISRVKTCSRCVGQSMDNPAVSNRRI